MATQPTHPNAKANILIIGQGDIGQPVTNKLAEMANQSGQRLGHHLGHCSNYRSDYNVTGLARGERHKYDLHDDAGFIQADALKVTAEQLRDFTHIAIIVTPDNYDADAYKNTYLGIAQHIADLSKELPDIERVVFISSTGVYGQNNGEWVDETVAPVTPEREGSIYILKAEQALQQAYGDKAVIIRPSGIYGKDRLMRIRKVKEDNKPAMPRYAWSNRIMDTDLIHIIAQVLTIDKAQLKPLYLATDYAPVSTYELAKWLCEQLDTSVPEIDDSAPVSGKRLHSNIPLAWLEYPDWQVGYQYILKTLN
ncbi:MAG: NAD-dependent epimerase/dehydratase family protein [Psychrobacter sp.]|nr:NAD-dependent epimerase/dehydratase family protein [Psychrobacter sp.]